MADHVGRVGELVDHVVEAMGKVEVKQAAKKAAALYKADLGSATV